MSFEDSTNTFEQCSNSSVDSLADAVQAVLGRGSLWIASGPDYQPVFMLHGKVWGCMQTL